jgi:KDO2-lipid IV(A) lauroyltransferase
MQAPDTAAFWRKLAYLGSRYGPRLFLEHSPAPIGLSISVAAPRARRNLEARLRDVLAPASPGALRVASARAFMQYAHCLAESLASGRPEAAYARCRFKEPGQGEALRSERGLVVVTAHAGAWDAAANMLARDFDKPVTIVMRPEASAGARAVHAAVRAQRGVEVVHVGQDATDALPLLRRLRGGGVVAFQIDRVPPGTRGLAVELFGRPSQVPEGPFRIAALAKVPLLPLFVRRVGHFDYELWGGPALSVPPRPSHAQLRAVAAKATWELERFLRAHPTQWFCFDGD